MTAHYQLDSSRSRFTVQAFAAGMLSFLGHSPTFNVQEFSGEMHLNPGPPPAAKLDLIVQAGSLTLVDRVSASDRREIEGRTRDEVLAVAQYPEIRFESADIAPRPVSDDQFRLQIRGRLTLRSVTNPVELTAKMRLDGQSVQLTGETPILLSAFRIPPITALGGTLKLKDQLKVAFDLTGMAMPAAVGSKGGGRE